MPFEDNNIRKDVYQTMCILNYFRDIKDPLESHRSAGNEIVVVDNDIVHEIVPG